ncbi:MAG: hypothetical protein OEX05_12115, partial [Chloroflexota bacterium]|nr:hypothetical protein [Chloroflexota bacterium]
TFLAGIAIGAGIFNVIQPRLRHPLRLLALTQAAVAAFALVGLVTALTRPIVRNPGLPFETLGTLFGVAFVVVLPATIAMGIAFPTASALLRDERSTAGEESGSLLAVNTTGAIIGSLVIPFVLMPTIGSPTIIAVLATVNACIAIALALVSRPRVPATAILGGAVLLAIAIAVVTPGVIRQPTEALIEDAGGAVFESTEDEIAAVLAGQIHQTPELWVAGTSMTLQTVDAKLMPVLPLAVRPDAKRALVVAFGMGTAYRTALIAGLDTDVVELVPSVIDMFRWYYDDSEAVLADDRGRVFVADGRNHLELSEERFDIIVTDPPPPIESSGASVISSKEYFEAGRDHLTPGGVMMQWVPYGAPEAEFKEHIRTFASVFPNVSVIRGPGGFGAYLLGSEAPVTLEQDDLRAVLSRPGVLEDVSSAYDSPVSTVDEWVAVIDQHQWLADADAVRSYVGDGPLITDDKPRPEYFLLRRLANDTAR